MVCYNLPGWQVNNNLNIPPGKYAKQGISGKKGANNNYDKSTIHLPRQQVAILKEWLKIRGCGSLEGDFYTRFMTGNWGLGLWRGGGKNSISAVKDDCGRSAIFVWSDFEVSSNKEMARAWLLPGVVWFRGKTLLIW